MAKVQASEVFEVRGAAKELCDQLVHEIARKTLIRFREDKSAPVDVLMLALLKCLRALVDGFPPDVQKKLREGIALYLAHKPATVGESRIIVPDHADLSRFRVN